MKVKVYQIFYDLGQLSQLCPEFTPLDNRENLRPELREYPVIKRCFDIARNEGVDMWGVVAPNWQEKFGFSAVELLKHLNKNTDYDACFIDMWTHQSMTMYNVWEQAYYHYPSIMEIMDAVCPHIGIDSTLIRQPMTRDNSFFCSTLFAKNHVWQEYFDFVDRYLECIPQLPPHLHDIHESSAKHNSVRATYFPFIQERLMSTFFLLHRHKYKLLPYHIHEANLMQEFHICDMYKRLAIERHDIGMCYRWLEQRNKIKYLNFSPQHFPNIDDDIAKTWFNLLW